MELIGSSLVNQVSSTSLPMSPTIHKYSHKPTRIKDFKDIDYEFPMEYFEPYMLKVKPLFEAFSCMVVLRLRGSTNLMFGLL